MDLQPPIGLNAFFPDLGGPAFAVLNALNPLEFWYVALLVLGVARLNRFSIAKSVAVVTPIWLSLLAFQVALTVAAGQN